MAGKSLFGWREQIRESVRTEAAKRMNGDMTLSPPPTDVCVTSTSGDKRVTFDEFPNPGFVEVGKRCARGCYGVANTVGFRAN